MWRLGLVVLLWLAVAAPAGADAGIQFTPTFIVNSEVYPGSYSIDEFSENIEPLVADN